ncbi:Uncharacterised protein [Clostridium putrefaciens]|uniref:Uncharacterized protein n=1 Tax=Clostridium putrefaciens TaxID=99675 RepID=A0A381J5K9_9CLOT|nr:hypothetical protein [Clostridium putrefaciens]SUY46060.1 Uncharacterised protein [Clostridium putrefaciens]
MDLLSKKLLRYGLLIQLYDDFFTYGYESCVDINYRIPRDCRIDVIAALYYINFRRWIFFNIEKDKTVSVYILGNGIDEIERSLQESGELLLSNIYKDVLIPVEEDRKGGDGDGNIPRASV